MPARKKTTRPIGKGEFAAALREIRDDPDREGTFEQSTIDAAMKGDAEAGMEALRIFIAGCDSEKLSHRMLHYIRDRLVNIVFDGMAPDVALCLFERGARGGEYPPSEVAACYFLLLRHGLKPGKAKAAMQAIFVREHKSISPRLIETTTKQYAPMQNFDDDLLLHMAGTKRKQIARLISPKR